MFLGQRVRLRPVERDDVPRFAKWFADADMRSCVAAYMPFGLDQEMQWYELNLRAGDTQAWAIDVRPDDSMAPWTHIGNCSFISIDWRNRAGEVGIFIGARDYWGRGYGTDAMQTLVAWGFGMLNLNRIGLRVYADNARAIRSYAKAGFKEEGRLRQGDFRNGVYRDVVLMSLLREEWESRSV